MDPIAAFVLPGAFIAVPAAVRLADPFVDTGEQRFGRWRVVWLAWFPAATALFASFQSQLGALAGLLAVPWLLWTVFVALLGMLRAAERGGGPWAEVAIDAGLVYLAIGGVWLLAARVGVPLLGFEEPWVSLTAAHFHFAGPVLPIVTGSLARRLPGMFGELASAGVVIGVPLVAIGITCGHRAGLVLAEFACAMVLIVATLAVAVSAAFVAWRERLAARMCLLLTSLSLTFGMTAATLWAMQRGFPAATADLFVWDVEDMLRWHAPLQVMACMAALAGLSLLARPAAVPAMEILLPWLGDRPRDGVWDGRAFGPDVTPGTAGVATDRHELELPTEAPGPPLANGPFRRAATAALCYRSFPLNMLVGLREPGPVHVGETVRARYRLLSFLQIVFAARVIDVFDSERDGVHRTGFTYRTLVGHPECGVETFAIEKELTTGKVRAVLFAHSRCATTLSRLLRPMCRRLQLAAGRAAVANLRTIALGHRA
ncbi:MAG: YndJ family transporter [Planctomycetes bacterium]|nr:YndJ family transporter [Planctomycetota bacterium]